MIRRSSSGRASADRLKGTAEGWQPSFTTNEKGKARRGVGPQESSPAPLREWGGDTHVTGSTPRRPPSLPGMRPIAPCLPLLPRLYFYSPAGATRRPRSPSIPVPRDRRARPPPAHVPRQHPSEKPASASIPDPCRRRQRGSRRPVVSRSSAAAMDDDASSSPAASYIRLVSSAARAPGPCIESTVRLPLVLACTQGGGD